MRHDDTSCGPISLRIYQRERMAYQNSSSNPYIVVQWCSDTISEITSAVISLMASLHTARQYRGLMMNFGMPSFLVGMQDIGPHEVS